MTLAFQCTVAVSLLFLAITNLVNGDAANYIQGSNQLQEAWIFPGPKKEGVRLRWEKSSNNWADLWSLLEQEGFFSIGRLCVRGVFIIYEEPNFGVSSIDAYEIISGNIRCKRIPESTKSIQSVGSLGQMGFPSITFFEKAHFGSEAHPTTVNQGSYFFSKMDQTQSAIIIGRDPWSLQTKDGQRFCLQPDFDAAAKKPICLIKSFAALLMIMDNPTIQFVKVSQGCANVEDERVYSIQDCMYWGKPPQETGGGGGVFGSDSANEVGSNDKPEGRTSPSANDICSHEEKKNLVFNLYKAAITGSLDTDLSVEWPKLGRNAWRLELLDLIFSIVMDTISPSLIVPTFFSRTREVFIQKLASVWQNDTIEEIDLPRAQQDYDSLIKYTTDCAERVKDVRMELKFFKAMDDVWLGIEKKDDFKGKIKPEFERKSELDIITEMVWIAGHIAGNICYVIGDRSGPFWALFTNLFYNWYMVPVVPEWKKPTEGLNLIFGGINYKLEYNKYAMFASMLVQVKLIEPLKRPAELQVEDKENDGDEN